MNATVLSPHRPVAVVDDLPIAFGAPANDASPTRSLGPEEPLLVTFEGLSPEEAQRALRSFPGARRVLLATF
jgi:hypothetical protein